MPKFLVEIVSTTYRTFEVETTDENPDASELALAQMNRDETISSAWKENATVSNISVNGKEREKLVEKYAQRCVEVMDIGDLMQYGKDRIEERLEKISDDELVSEIEQFHPEILEN